MFKQELEQLNQLVQEVLGKTTEQNHLDIQVSRWSAGIKQVAMAINAIGQQAYDFIQEDEGTKETSSSLAVAYQCTFYWIEQAKQFTILWRDILLEHQKARVLLLDKKTTPSAVSTLNLQSKEVLHLASQELCSYFEQTPISSLFKSEQKFRKKHEAQTNPFPVLKKQINVVVNQATTFQEETEKLISDSNTFHSLKKTTLTKGLEDSLNEIEQHQELLNEVIHLVKTPATSSIGKIVKQFEQKGKEIAKLSESPSQLANQLKQETEKLHTEVTVPLSTDAGMVQVRDINVQKHTRQWLESEILPQLYEVLELTKEIRTSLKLSILNVHNRALLLSNEDKELASPNISTQNLSRPLLEFSRIIEEQHQACKEIKKTVSERLEKEFNISSIYQKNEDFLSIPLQNTINRLVFGQTDVIDSVKQYWNKVRNKVIALKSDVEREDSLSISEKIVRYLERRTPKANNNQYSAIFLTEGYVGESFRVGREQEIERVKNLVEQWKNGYRGAILLTGQRFSGKTLFGEYILERFFGNRFITLHPYTEVRFEGRHIQTKGNLEEALSFVKKYTHQSHTTVWIDNLEIWSNNKYSLAENVRALQKFADNTSHRIFIIVSLSNWLKAHLDKNMDFNRYFQADINLDFMPKSDIKKAIAIRHGATHKKLLDTKGEEVTPHSFHQMMSATYNHSQGNIGEALLSWVNALESSESGEVRRHKNPIPPLPDFITTDTATLLSTIMLKRYINEYELSKLFGSAWSSKYKGILQRLLGLGLLERSAAGRLFITQVAVNDIGRLLEKHHYLKFNK